MRAGLSVVRGNPLDTRVRALIAEAVAALCRVGHSFLGLGEMTEWSSRMIWRPWFRRFGFSPGFTAIVVLPDSLPIGQIIEDVLLLDRCLTESD
ncbi:MAG TPA: hypothetical protein VIY49_10980 [Bryobacteraceae bacterium]